MNDNLIFKSLLYLLIIFIFSCSESDNETNENEPNYDNEYLLESCPNSDGLTDINGYFLLKLRALGYDTDNDQKISCSEAENIIELDLGEDNNIGNLTGIESLINLKKIQGEIEGLGIVNLYNNILLEEIDFSGNNNHTLVLPNSVTLEKLNAFGCGFRNLHNVSNQSNLEFLIFNGNRLENSLSLENCSKLIEINFGGNTLTELILGNHPYLKTINLFSQGNLPNYDRNYLNSIDLSNVPLLEILDLTSNNFDYIDLTNNPNLKELLLTDNKLPNINLSNNQVLDKLYLSNNLITNIDLSDNSILTLLYLNDNDLASLNLTNNIELKSIKCENNNINELDLSLCYNLRSLYAKDNNLTYLNLKHGNYNLMSYMDARNNQLSCIQIDEGYDPTNRTDWFKDAGTIYSSDCN